MSILVKNIKVRFVASSPVHLPIKIKQAVEISASTQIQPMVPSSSIGKFPNPSLVELKQIEFHLAAPFAGSVKLAADFTDWEKFPPDMMKSENDVWHAVVPLPAGSYSYRFIVDGEWCDDLRPGLRVHNNPFAPASAVVKAT